MEIVALDETTAPAWQALFEASGSPCFCRYWHFEGKKNDWLERCALRPEENRDEQLALVRSGAPEARGLLAMEGATAVGWMEAFSPRARLPKLPGARGRIARSISAPTRACGASAACSCDPTAGIVGWPGR